MGWLEDMLGVPSKPTLGVGELQNPLAALQAQPGPAPQASLGGAPPLGVGGGADFESQARSNAALAANATSRQQAAETGMQAELAEKTALAEAQRANRERVAEERRTALYADIDRQQKDILAEAARAPAIDPGKGVRDMGAAGAIGTIASGFLSGLINPKGGANDIVQLVTQIADRSVQTQVANQEQRNKLLGLRQQALGGDLARGRDLIDAELAATVRAYDSAARTFAAEAQKKWGGEIGAAKSQAIISGIRDGLLLRVQGWRDKKQELGIAGMNAETQRASQAETVRHDKATEDLGAADLGLKAAAKGSSPLPGLTPKEARELEIHGPDGKTLGYGYNVDDAKNLRKQIQSFEDFRADLSDYKDLLQKYGRESSGLLGTGKTDARVVLEAKHKRIVTTMKEIQKLGVLSGPDMELLEGQIPPPRGWLAGADPLPAVDEALAHADESMDRFIAANVQGAKAYRAVSKPMPGEQHGGTSIDPSKPFGKKAARGLPGQAPDEEMPILFTPSAPGTLRR